MEHVLTPAQEQWVRSLNLGHLEAPVGNKLSAPNWTSEAAMRMLINNLDHRVAEQPENLVVYGGIGKAARNEACFRQILRELLTLGDTESLLIQSGKPVGRIRSHSDAPRVLIANSNLVPHWANWQHFDELDRKGLMMYGQMTAGSWIYIGSQGIVQGTYETFAAAARKHYNSSSLAGKLVVSAGLGGMGGAQPLAAKIAGATSLFADVNPVSIEKRLKTGYLDFHAASISEAVTMAKSFQGQKKAASIGVQANAVELLQYLIENNIVPDLLTDQTSAHDALRGYIPEGLTVMQAADLRNNNPSSYLQRSLDTMVKHVQQLSRLQQMGSHTFDYGNNIRGQALAHGYKEAFAFPGFVPAYVRPMFCEGNGPFRFVALSGDPQDIHTCDQALLALFSENSSLQNWLKVGAPQIAFQGLPARICWLRYGEREKAGALINDLVRDKKVSAPIVIGRDHLDSGSVASPNRETEGMLDGSDAVSDWPLLNLMSNAIAGASWVSFHHGGGVGMGYSQHAGVVIVADGSKEAHVRLSRVLHNDPLLGVYRHADAGYQQAKDFANKNGISIPL